MTEQNKGAIGPFILWMSLIIPSHDSVDELEFPFDNQITHAIISEIIPKTPKVIARPFATK
jgi:hypothetical protein